VDERINDKIIRKIWWKWICVYLEPLWHDSQTDGQMNRQTFS